MKRLFSNIWFWLTVPVICAWCRSTMHRAPLFWLGNSISHGVCKACDRKYFSHL